MDASEGPSGYLNWRQYQDSHDEPEIIEVPLYSDAHITGQLEVDRDSDCPYGLLNAIAADTTTVRIRHTLTLRAYIVLDAELPEDRDTDTSTYHGGWLATEMSALMSLLLGVRLKPGGITRDYSLGDPLGIPLADRDAPAYLSPINPHDLIVPYAISTKNINELAEPLLLTYPKMATDAAIALTRAARLFQDALWLVESEPEFAWLFLVAAIEVLATFVQVVEVSPEEILERSLPNLHEYILELGGEDALGEVSEHLAHLLRATGRFIGFMLKYLPDEPEYRPEKGFFIPWTNGYIRNALSMVYSYRSAALHGGTPFPKPMCQSPFFGGLYCERPPGLWVEALGGRWTQEDLPMLIHIFAHIVRGSILKWWSSYIRLEVE